jgi:cold shock CspA family protein
VSKVKEMIVEIKKGKLQHFTRGFGFIRTIENGIYVDLFFHVTSVHVGEPVVGCDVEFCEGISKGRRVAVNVRFAKPAAVTTGDVRAVLGPSEAAIQALAEKTGAEGAL